MTKPAATAPYSLFQHRHLKRFVVPGWVTAYRAGLLIFRRTFTMRPPPSARSRRSLFGRAATTLFVLPAGPQLLEGLNVGSVGVGQVGEAAR
jgi:hypothetical protein